MSRSKSISRVGAALLGLCVAGAALAAERPDFTGVWGNYRAPGAAPAATRRRASAVTAACRTQGQGRRVPRARRSARRDAGRLLPRHGNAGLDARLGRLSDGDRAAREPHPRRLRGARRNSPHLSAASARNPEDLFPDRNGYSFGRWEGDKLIVETTHLKEAVDQGRYPHSDQREDRRGIHAGSERRRHEGADVEDDDDGSRLLHADDHGREEVAVPARRALAAVRVQRAAVGRAPRAVCVKGRARPAEP